MSSLKIPVTPDDHSRGPKSAPLVFVVYGDFQCVHCAKAHAKLRHLETMLGNRLRYVFRHFPRMQFHPYSLLGAMSAEAAGCQGKFWEMHDLIFEQQEHLDPEGIEWFARSLQLDIQAFHRATGNASLEMKIRRDYMGGVRSGVSGTPTLFLNGALFEGPLEMERFREFLEAA